MHTNPHYFTKLKVSDKAVADGRLVRFGWTTISQRKNKIPFYKKQVINKGTRVILDLFSLLYYDTIDRKGI